jgi:hypothetical protein
MKNKKHKNICFYLRNRENTKQTQNSYLRLTNWGVRGVPVYKCTPVTNGQGHLSYSWHYSSQYSSLWINKTKCARVWTYRSVRSNVLLTDWFIDNKWIEITQRNLRVAYGLTFTIIETFKQNGGITI